MTFSELTNAMFGRIRGVLHNMGNDSTPEDYDDALAALDEVMTRLEAADALADRVESMCDDWRGVYGEVDGDDLAAPFLPLLDCYRGDDA